ncbi:MAG: hypothetical protein EPO07_16455 [Verrucomicrobia bacterium]|nr:MAG: hypothetical protein EPO07_16455 [Verrucomicrobiota bacterium]
MSLVPLERDYLFLTEGDDTPSVEGFDFALPQWLADKVSGFSRSAFIEAEFWGGDGMQASVVFEQSKILLGPEISAGAINSALRQMGIVERPSITFFGLPVTKGKDPFDMVGLGKHRSVSAWLRASNELSAS